MIKSSKMRSLTCRVWMPSEELVLQVLLAIVRPGQFVVQEPPREAIKHWQKWSINGGTNPGVKFHVGVDLITMQWVDVTGAPLTALPQLTSLRSLLLLGICVLIQMIYRPTGHHLHSSLALVTSAKSSPERSDLSCLAPPLFILSDGDAAPKA